MSSFAYGGVNICTLVHTRDHSFHKDPGSPAMIINERGEDRMVGFGDDRDSWSFR